MKRIIHLSDLHFGTEREGLVDLLIKDVNEHHPDLIIVSGDLTQRARINQYQAANAFFSKLMQKNILCVPGNHDISLYNLIERIFYPFKKYKKWISSDICTFKYLDHIAILGINSVTPYKPMGGYITNSQFKLIENFFSQQSDSMLNMVVMHHNLIKSERHKIINEADKIIDTFLEYNVKLVLSGHIHYSCIEEISRYEKSLFVITAGTPISTRTIQPNSYNILDCEPAKIKLLVRAFEGGQFVDSSQSTLSL